jgi:hypothetical protein
MFILLKGQSEIIPPHYPLKLKPGTVLKEKYYYNVLRQSGLVLVFIFSKPCILNSTFSVMQLVSTCFKCKSIA